MRGGALVMPALNTQKTREWSLSEHLTIGNIDQINHGL